MKFLISLSAFLLILTGSFQLSATQTGQITNPTPVFINGEGGYRCFRIPAIVCTNSGRLIAFAEGRKNGCSDTGDIDLVTKTSDDHGKTWSALKVIRDDKENTCGNPAPVFDTETGITFLLFTWNLGKDSEGQIIAQTSTDTRRIFILCSEDEGENWSAPQDITASVKPSEWTWYATGPGSGIQLIHPPHRGRLMIACDHIEAISKKYFSHVIFSDDHGYTWQLGGTTPADQVNECEVAELENGQLILNMRNYDRSEKTRQVAFSEDGGMSWYNQHHVEQLPEPICQASLQTYRYKKKQALLFTNPASTEERENMTLRLSFDEGKTWPRAIVLHEGPAAYSDLVVDKNGRIGCLYECGSNNPYEQIIYSALPFPAVSR